MSLYAEWRNLCDNHANNDEEIKFWENYLKSEAGIYNEILNNKTDVVEGTVAELAAKYNVSNELFMGFLDGISESVKEELELEAIEADTNVSVKIDWEKLYYNMLGAEAHWLYELQGWDGILSPETRKAITKDFNRSRIVVKEDKVGRNVPCPCGSGKKYKKCCGK